MNEFSELLKILDRLLGPDGCPWDKEQNLFTLQAYLLEEAHELIEAIDQGDASHIAEELGDVFFTLVFIGKLGEREKLFTLDKAIRLVSEKLIRRHPHIFSDAKVDSSAEVIKNWEAIKKTEKGRESILDGIPKAMPQLSRAQKIVEKLRRSKSDLAPTAALKKSEKAIGESLWKIVADAQNSGIDSESALRRYTATIEKKHRRLIRGKN